MTTDENDFGTDTSILDCNISIGKTFQKLYSLEENFHAF